MQNATAVPRFLRTSLVYFLGNFLSKLALFFMIPIYTARIPAEDMGVFDASVAVAVLVSSVLFLDIGVGMMRFYLARQSEGEGDTVLLSGLCLMGIATLLYLLLGAVLFCFLTVAYYPFIVLYGLCNALFLACGFIARAKGRATLYAAAGVLSTLLQVACNLVLLLVAELGYVALYISYAVGTGAGVLLLLLACRVWELPRRARPDLAVMRRLTVFCLPLGGGAAAYWVMTSLGRVLVTALVGEAAGGAFAVSHKFAQIVLFASVCFRFAWQEVAFAKGYQAEQLEMEKSGYYDIRISLLLRTVAAVLLVLIPISRIGLWFFPDFIASDYSAAHALVPVALLGAALLVIADFLEPIFGALKKTGSLLLTTAVGAGLSLLLTLLFIKLGLGALSAHLALCLACLVTLLLRLFLLSRFLGVRLCWRYLLLLPTVLGVLAAFYSPSPLISLAVLCLLLPLTLWLLPELRQIGGKIACKHKSI